MPVYVDVFFVCDRCQELETERKNISLGGEVNTECEGWIYSENAEQLLCPDCAKGEEN